TDMTESLETETLENELEDLINQLLIINLLLAMEFINIDEDIADKKGTIIKEIADIVKSIGVEEKSKEVSVEKMFVYEVLKYITLLQNFISQNNLDVD
ncbi:13547_t:CDS:1, partial [Acaulospora morrowiae]